MFGALGAPFPASVSSFLQTILERCPGIAEIWLVGSRANAAARVDSDWDLLAFADQQTLEDLRLVPGLARRDVDLLIVLDGNQFECPWERPDKPGKFKRGRLTAYIDQDGVESSSWEWTKLSDNEAEYAGEGFKPQRAVRIYERTAASNMS
jgi:predicted nucleotidyltransferase